MHSKVTNPTLEWAIPAYSLMHALLPFMDTYVSNYISFTKLSYTRFAKNKHICYSEDGLADAFDLVFVHLTNIRNKDLAASILQYYESKE